MVQIPLITNWSVFPQNGDMGYFDDMNVWIGQGNTVIPSANASIVKMNEAIVEINNIAENAINAITFDNIAQLKLHSNIGRVDILGYYTKGDGGGGTFYWDSTSTEDDNGGTIIQATGITTGRWKRAYSGVVNVKWFGARGTDISSDGVHFDYNDAPYIQNAINYVFSLGGETLGGTVFIPKGKYPIKEPIYSKIGVKIIGDGATGLVSIDPLPSSGTVLILAIHKPDNTSWTSTTLPSGNVTVNYQVMFIHVQGVASFSDMGLITQNNDSSKSIAFLSGLDKSPYNGGGFSQGVFDRIRAFGFNSVFRTSRMDDCYFNNCGFEYNICDLVITNGFNQSDVLSMGSFAHNGFSNCVFYGGYANFAILNDAHVDSVSFSGCSFIAPTAPSFLSFIYFGSDSGTSIVERMKFDSCSFSCAGSNVGKKVIYMDTSNPYIDGIYFSNCSFKDTSFAINYTTTVGSLKGLSIVNCYFDNTRIEITYELELFVINSNIFTGNSYILLTLAQKGSLSSNNMISTSHNQTYDVVLLDASSDIIVNGNILSTKGLSKHPATIRYKILSNLNVTDAIG